MITIIVKTEYQGMIAIRDKYIKEAINAGEDLVIHHDGESMRIPCAKINDRIFTTSDKPFTNRYERDSHYLIYFPWVPDAKQGRML